MVQHADIDHTGLPGVGGGGIDEGTAFPGSPVADDLFYRTDRNLIYFYDGTRWLTVNLYESHFGWSQAGLTSDQGVAYFPVDSTYALYLVELITSSIVIGTNNGSNFWEMELVRIDTSNTQTEIGVTSTVADTAGQWVRHTLSVNAVLDSGARVLYLRGDETGSAGTLSFGAAIRYRYIG